MKVNISKVAIIYLCFVVLGIGAIVRIIDLQYIHKPDYEVIAKTSKEREIPCTRGSILASDGRLLAFSIPEYRLYMDCTLAPDSTFNAKIDELADSLAFLYGDKKAVNYSNYLQSQRKAGRQYTCISKQLLTYQQMKRAEQFPIFDLGRRKGGLIVEKFDRRQYPYDKLAFRTLGHINANEPKPIGLEGSCDSILRGANGIQTIRKTEHNNWIPDSDGKYVEPIDGADVQSTLDIDIQDISERALRRQMALSDELEAGCAIVMEVATGEIKAMVNMRKDEHGQLCEEYNYAIGRKGEPGSVFKLATLTILLDEGKIRLDDEINAVVTWQYGKGKPFIDHYLDKYKTISILRGFEISSNNVFRMSAARFYGNNPSHFIDKLNNDLKISRNYDFDIAGFAKAHIKDPKDPKQYWSQADLPQIAMGYTCELTPLHTLTFYNAIANGGMMVQPRLIRNFQKNGVIIKEFPVIEVGRVCKKETVPQLHRAMRSVVLNGTGRHVFNGCKVEVAGKTGTSRVVMPNGRYEMDGRKKHQASFAGFFPADSPKYSIIAVVWSVPTSKNFYGATWAGPVVREIAEEVYASSPDWGEPIVASGEMPAIKEYDSACFNDNLQGVPNVLGMGLRDALAYLENNGYSVSFEGKGLVSAQSPSPGDATANKKIHLTLSVKGNKTQENETPADTLGTESHKN